MQRSRLMPALQASILAFTSPLLLQAPAPTPHTQLAGTALSWFTVFNSGDTAALRRFAATQYDSATLAQRGGDAAALLVTLFPQTRGLDPARIAYENPERVVILATARLTGAWLRFFFLSTGAPARSLIIGGYFIYGRAPEALAQRDFSVTEVRDSAAAITDRLARADEWSGVVGISVPDESVTLIPRGLAQRGAGVPITEVSRFALGSFTRAFASIATCQLLEQGRVNRLAPIASYLPELRSAPAVAALTIGDLVSGTSGLGSLPPNLSQDSAGAPFLARALTRIAADSLQFRPGDDMQASDEAAVLLAALVERVTGTRYGDYVEKQILAQAGMSHTALGDAAGGGVVNYVPGPWRKEFHPGEGNAHASPIEWMATPDATTNGVVSGGWTTAGDLLSLASALDDGLLMRPISRIARTPGYGPGAWPVGQELCGFSRSTEADTVLTATGSAPGAAVRLELFLARGTAVVTVSNRGGLRNGYVANRLRELLTTHAAVEPRAPIGDVRVLHAFRSRFLAQPRDVRVYLPPGYAAHTEQRYAVLYMHDGQDVFAGGEGGGGGWSADSVLQAAISSGELPPLIVVAIDNTGAEYRFDDYTPTRVRGQGGGAAAYLRMLVEELKPQIDATYRTRPDPAHTLIGGASLGGLVSLYAGLERPDVFGRVMAMSPSVFWDGRYIIRQVSSLPAALPVRIWIDAGTAEGTDVTRDVGALADALREKGWLRDSGVTYMQARGASHHAEAWKRRLIPALQFLTREP